MRQITIRATLHGSTAMLAAATLLTSGQAQAQTVEAGADTGGDEIIVTAQKREQ